MHYKKRKLHKLHSIPIDLCNNINRSKRLYLVSYGIPLSCMVVLLLIGIFAINPSLALKTSAVTIQDEWVVKDSESENDDSDSAIPNESVEGSSDGDIMPLYDITDPDAIPVPECETSPSLTMILKNTDQTIQTVQGGDVVYGVYNMALGGCYIKDYAVSIKADSTNLTMPNGVNSSTSTVTGANGATGDNIVANTWGYTFVNSRVSSGLYGGLAYDSLPTTSTVIDHGTSTGKVELQKKLIFAAKFAEDAAPGTYTGHITLSAVATEITQLWSDGTDSGIRNMQDISAGFCKSSLPTGTTINLRDNRDSKEYMIYKAADGNCWMGQNLSLTGPMTLTSSNSDVSSNWTLPASSDSSWSTDNGTAQMRNGKSGMTVSSNLSGDGKGWRSGFGNYYSWAAATAGTGTTSVTSADASSSICPKGWKLPTYSGDYSFSNLTSTKSSWLTGQTINGTANMSGYYFGSTATNLAKGANFWPAAGSVRSDGLRNPGTSGFYWSRRAYSNSDFAYYLTFNSYGASLQYDYGRYFGYSVRCVATY